nr:cysteine-rich secretory protein 2-like [Onthophagus taurus]
MKFHNQTILRGVIRNVQRYIVRKHNKFRSVVKPAASNMLRMRWHVGAAKSAQNWANQCMFLTHDDSKGRNDKNYGACGQNIFVSTHPVQWLFAMRTWFAEKKYFTYGSTKNNLKLVGHYTQMVWATSQFVGCGFAKCDKNSGFPGKSTYYNYVCNYCPS